MRKCKSKPVEELLFASNTFECVSDIFKRTKVIICIPFFTVAQTKS